MNAVEIEAAISELAEEPFDAGEFPFAFLRAFGNKETTLKRLRAGASNASDVGGVLQRNNIHIKACRPGEGVADALAALKASPATARAKARFILATDGEELHAEDLDGEDLLVCRHSELPDRFGFFLPLAGITTVRQIRENAFDIRATRRLNQLHVELVKGNPGWGTDARRHDMNRFMARLIFCFFAEDTDILAGRDAFTDTIERMSAKDGSNTHEVIREVFRAMNVERDAWKAEGVPRWAAAFPYVNGGLFADLSDVPRFSRVARSYLLNVGRLDWKKINPDIFGSMIQAVADEGERGELGMHYTSVPNILKVLEPLFLNDLRSRLAEAGTNARKLLNLRRRMARIRVFDPACGSGNFLVVAYKEMRGIEAEVNRRRGEPHRQTVIRLTNFRGIEIRGFAAEIARLALIIAEYQCDMLHRGGQYALAEFLPLDARSWIACGNALRLDWLQLCPPAGTAARARADTLLDEPTDRSEVDFANAGGETYICSNPPYRGSHSGRQTGQQKADLKAVFEGRTKHWKSLDYVSGWFMKAADYGAKTGAAAALVSTNSICQGRQVGTLWPLVMAAGHEIAFAHTSFKWANLASRNAGVTVVVVGISRSAGSRRLLFSAGDDGRMIVRKTENVNPYLLSAPNVVVRQSPVPLSDISEMNFGSMPNDGGHLLLTVAEAAAATSIHAVPSAFIRRFFGAKEFIRGEERRCIWVGEDEHEEARKNPWLRARFDAVRKYRLNSVSAATRDLAAVPFRFGSVRRLGERIVIVVPGVSSESREWFPVGAVPPGTVISNAAFTIPDAPLWNMATIASKLHLAWIGAVCGRLATRYRYSNTLGWNTFPVPRLTAKNRADLTTCAENILLAREFHFPAALATLYEPGKMPENLRAAHERNDEVLERIYIGRRFRNDTERLEKLFGMYSRTAREGAPGKETAR